eukprot:TRINITY_DN12698_c0_g3_i1.p1 TRINITY_DN12698_c0_g3~~TRINITY_DN12698_c0_g3_i1.p1  ORF type:complete len:401 (-),score=110.36 TRINITY_DN12698_c0_g3_i1:65-1240(-)
MVLEGEFADCISCQKSISSVMRANLLLFQTIIAGDSWGVVAVPIIERYPAAAIIFMGAQLTLVFGVLNLVVAVVVDSAAEQREKDIQLLAEEMELESEDDLQFLKQVFTKIDKDGSGELDYDELLQGARTVPEFAARLRVMDIDQEDLGQLFQMLDENGSGVIEPDRFIHALNRWVRESKTAGRFVKYMMMRNLTTNESFHETVAAKFKEVTQSLQALEQKQDILLKAEAEHQQSVAEKPVEEDVFGSLTTLMKKLKEEAPATEFTVESEEPCSPELSNIKAQRGLESFDVFQEALKLTHEAVLASLEAAEARLRQALLVTEQSAKGLSESQVSRPAEGPRDAAAGEDLQGARDTAELTQGKVAKKRSSDANEATMGVPARADEALVSVVL